MTSRRAVSPRAVHDSIVKAIDATAAAPVVDVPLSGPHIARLDLSLKNPLVAATDCRNPAEISELIQTVLERSNARYGIGGYDEKRGWYARGAQFSEGTEVRSIHIGVDIWGPAGTKVYAPYDGAIHSAQDNDLVGDYGPTIILQHTLQGETFYTLYGHLSRESLEGCTTGSPVKAGTCIGAFGAPPHNGDWPPHLHFQIITDMLGKSGDYPGVATESAREEFLLLCPDPNLVLRSPLL